MKTFCFKLYHSEHNYKLIVQINAAGLIYNHCIALHKRYYRLYGKYLDKCKLQQHLVKLKKHKKFAYIREIGSQAVQDVTDRIDRAYNLFWHNLKQKKKCSPPNFRKVRRYKSFTLKQAGWKLDETNGKIRIGKKWYGYFKSRNIEGTIKTVTIKRDNVGDIYIYLICDVQCDIVKPRTGKSVGFDFGLKQFLTGSDGHNIKSPYFFMLNIKNIRKKCRNLSHKKEGSHNHNRARKELSRAYMKINNQRKDFHFKTARMLCEEYAVICLEDLNIKGMARRWGRKVHSLGFHNFVEILKYEALKLGTQIVFVDRYFPSSQLCSVCGYKNKAVKDLKIREWVCPNCGTHHDRDRNAAQNILMAGTSAIGGEPVPYGAQAQDTRKSARFVDTRILRF